MLLVTLAHAALNGAAYVLPTANTLAGDNLGASIIGLALVVIVVIAITIWSGPARLSRTKQMQVEGGELSPGPAFAPASS